MTDARRLNRLNIQLSPEGATALDALVRTTKLSRTDLANRALRLYQVVTEQEKAGSELTLLRPDGNLDRVWLT